MGGFKQNQGISSNAVSLPQQQGLTIQAACYTDAAVMAHLMLADKQLSLARRSHPQIREIRPPGENGCSAWWALWRPIPAELPPKTQWTPSYQQQGRESSLPAAV